MLRKRKKNHKLKIFIELSNLYVNVINSSNFEEKKSEYKSREKKKTHF